MLAMPGVPGIYFHSLVGSRNYYKGVEESGIKRRINREKLNFDDLAHEISKEGSLRNQVFTFYKKILNIRTHQKTFNPLGKATYINVENNKVFVIKREHQGETVFSINNFSNKKVEIKSLSSKVFDLINNSELKKEIWEIEPYGFSWFKKIN